MFKKLKEKITEEVKSSPHRLQQFLQQQQQQQEDPSTAAAADDNLFTLSEDDANASTSTMEAGFTSVSLNQRSRKNSNSSIASDVSFLPHYESSPNMYHLQSDFEVSASEMEDNASTSSQLGHLTKEQIYSAFRKAQKQHHKYRGRYVDLARHYKELERENAKMKSVLVETQDKAIRRVAELKEQCNLEQKAKAHLENALRVDLDEKQYKIETLQTQIALLQQQQQQNGSGDVETQNGENLDLLRKYLNDARTEIETLNTKLQELKANTIVFQSKENDYKNKILALEKEINQHSERERENNLKLAQNKMELHNELLVKDTEISNLKIELETLKQPKESLQVQNKKLIEKVESLTQKCNNYEAELLKMEQYKIEIKTLTENVAQLKKINEDVERERGSLEEKLLEQRESAKKALLSLEDRIKEQLSGEYAEKEEKLRLEFQQKIETLTPNQDLQKKLFEQQDFNQNLQQEICSLNEHLGNLQRKYKELEDNHLELIKEASEQRNKINELNKELEETRNTNNGFEDEVSRLKANLKKFQDVLGKVKMEKQQLVEEKTKLDVLYNENQVKYDELHSKYLNVLDENQNLKENFVEIETLQKEIANLEGFRVKSEEVTAENETLTVQIAELEVKLQEYKEEVDAKGNVIEDFKIEMENLRTKLMELQQKNEALNVEIVELKREEAEKISELNKKLLDDFKSEKEDLNTKLVELQQKNEALNAKISELKLKETEKHSELQEAFKIEKENLNTKLMELQQKNEALNVEIVELKREEAEKISELNKKLLDDYKCEKEDLNAKLMELQQKNDVLNTEIAKLKLKETEKHSFKIEIDNLTTKLHEKNEALTKLETKLREEIDLKENLQIKILDLQQEKNKISTELEAQLKKEIVLNKKLEEDFKNEKQLLNNELRELQQKSQDISADNSRLLNELSETKIKLDLAQIEVNNYKEIADKIASEKQLLLEENNTLKTDFEKEKEQVLKQTQHADINQLKQQINILQEENKQFKDELINMDNLCKEKNDLEAQLKVLEHQYGEILNEKQLLQDEVQELKTAPINLNKSPPKPNQHEQEINELHEKLIQYQSMELTNKTSIEFYQNEIEKLKIKNEKLNRKLDETLVTLNHCAELSNSTEIEYLRNVLYNYMLGKESVVLARVIAAVCKFDEHQTEMIMQKELQRQSLMPILHYKRRGYMEQMEELVGEVSVVDVYDIASDIGKECEKIIDQYGADAVTSLMPKVINALELLENLATKNERENSQLLELRAKIAQLENDKIEKAEYRQKFERELEIIEEQWRMESKELVNLVSRLQEENRRLAKGQGQEMVATVPAEDGTVLQSLRATLEKQRDELKLKEKLLQEKNGDVEILKGQVERLTNQSRELRRKHRTLQTQVRTLCDERADFLVRLQDQQRDIGALRQRLGLAQKENEDLAKCDLPLPCNKAIYDLDDPNRPRFTTEELKDILHERNELKTRVSDLEDELEAYRPKNKTAETPQQKQYNVVVAETPVYPTDEDAPVQGPLPYEPDDAPWKRTNESGIRKFFRKLFSESGSGSGFPRRSLSTLSKMALSATTEDSVPV